MESSRHQDAVHDTPSQRPWHGRAPAGRLQHDTGDANAAAAVTGAAGSRHGRGSRVQASGRQRGAGRWSGCRGVLPSNRCVSNAMAAPCHACYVSCHPVLRLEARARTRRARRLTPGHHRGGHDGSVICNYRRPLAPSFTLYSGEPRGLLMFHGVSAASGSSSSTCSGVCCRLLLPCFLGCWTCSSCTFRFNPPKGQHGGSQAGSVAGSIAGSEASSPKSVTSGGTGKQAAEAPPATRVPRPPGTRARRRQGRRPPPQARTPPR